MKGAITHVLFDLDGTLTDSKAGIINSTLWAFEQMGLPVPSESEIEIGPPILQTIARLVGPGREPLYDEVIRSYRKRYSEKGVYECRPYEGIETVLNRLRAAAVPSFVATSKPTVFAEKILNHFSMANYFIKIYGSELDGTRTDKAELISYLIKTEGLEPASVVMIGDRKHDILGAKTCGVATIGAGWGYGSVEELLTAGASAVCSRPEDLLLHLFTE